MGRRSEHAPVAIVGLGNVLLADDGVGVHAIRRLREDAPEGAVLAEVGAAVFDALDLFERVDFVVAIDAVRAGGPAGSIYRFDVDDVWVQKQVSLHEYGLAAALRSLPAGSRPQVTILGVEPAVLDYGLELSPAVRAVLPRVVQLAREMAAPGSEERGRRPAPDRSPVEETNPGTMGVQS